MGVRFRCSGRRVQIDAATFLLGISSRGFSFIFFEWHFPRVWKHAAPVVVHFRSTFPPFVWNFMRFPVFASLDHLAHFVRVDFSEVRSVLPGSFLEIMRNRVSPEVGVSDVWKPLIDLRQGCLIRVQFCGFFTFNGVIGLIVLFPEWKNRFPRTSRRPNDFCPVDVELEVFRSDVLVQFLIHEVFEIADDVLA